MSPRRSRVAALLAALALGASPAAALGQSAGDDQYEDPFADETPQAQGTPPPAPTATAPPSTGTGSGSGSAPAAPTPAPGAPTTPSAPVPAGTAELPRTGLDAWFVALLGGGLVLAGAGLRLRLRDGARRA